MKRRKKKRRSVCLCVSRARGGTLSFSVWDVLGCSDRPPKARAHFGAFVHPFMRHGIISLLIFLCLFLFLLCFSFFPLSFFLSSFFLSSLPFYFPPDRLSVGAFFDCRNVFVLFYFCFTWKKKEERERKKKAISSFCLSIFLFRCLRILQAQPVKNTRTKRIAQSACVVSF